MLITTEEIYTLASEVTEQEINNVIAKFTEGDQILFDNLVNSKLPKGIALFTVIAKKYNNP